MLGGRAGCLGIEHDVEVGRAEPGEIGGAGAQRRHHVHVDAEIGKEAADLDQVVPVAEAQRRRPRMLQSGRLPAGRFSTAPERARTSR